MVIDNKRIPRKNAPISATLRIRFDVWLALAVLGLVVAGMLQRLQFDTGTGLRGNRRSALLFPHPNVCVGIGFTGNCRHNAV